jgi:hypothetical protein
VTTLKHYGFTSILYSNKQLSCHEHKMPLSYIGEYLSRCHAKNSTLLLDETNKVTMFIIEIDRLGLLILTRSDKYSCFVEPLDKIKRELDAMLSYHRKAFVFRTNLRIEMYNGDNEVMTKYIRIFIPWLKRKH